MADRCVRRAAQRPIVGRHEDQDMNPLPTEFETQRLRLRPATADDAEAIYAEYAQDPEVTKYLSWKPYTHVEPLRQFLATVSAACDYTSRAAWLISIQPAEHPVGMIDSRIDAHRFNFGYVLARKYWGRGYMVEALEPLVAWAFAQPEIHRVWAFCDIDNRASARVLEKLGMQQEGILRRWFIHPNISGQPRDCRCYSRVRGATQQGVGADAEQPS
jgi:RimJ/RimL family protein N-acetyltransferase